MTIYRGPGGTGSATSDSDTTQFQGFVTQAEDARDAALAAQTAAELAETNAETAQTAAESAQAAAETAETNAENSASDAADSATLAASFTPSQTGNAGKYLTTDGTSTSWSTVSSAGTVTSVAATVPAFLSVTGSPITSSGTLAISYSGTALPIANGGTGATSASAARTSLGATTLGGNLFTITNVAAIAFPRFNADNTISSLNASDFRTAIGAGTSSTTGTVTSVGGTGTVSGLTLTGTVTSSGSLTLGGTLSVAASNFSSQTANTFLAAPNGSSGAPTFRAIVAADVPTLNQNTTGTAANVSGTVAVANGGTGATSASAARTALGLAIGTNVQAWDADLDTWATKTAPTGTVIGTSDTQTLTNKTVTNLVFDGNYTEEVFTITDGASVDLNPANGTVQLWTLGANRSPTATSFAAGQSMTLMVADGTAFTITWPSVTWVGGSAPTLATTGYTVIELWEVGTTLYGALVGSVA
jgi:hypothetical protein